VQAALILCNKQFLALMDETALLLKVNVKHTTLNGLSRFFGIYSNMA